MTPARDLRRFWWARNSPSEFGPLSYEHIRVQEGATSSERRQRSNFGFNIVTRLTKLKAEFGSEGQSSTPLLYAIAEDRALPWWRSCELPASVRMYGFFEPMS